MTAVDRWRCAVRAGKATSRSSHTATGRTRPERTPLGLLEIASIGRLGTAPC